MKLSKRHIAKTISWRFIGTLDTVLISWIISGNLNTGLQIGLFEIITKMVFYYFHELFWFKSSVENSNKRHLIKTFSWRAVGTIDTMFIGWFITSNPLIGLKIGSIEVISKMLLYFLHEKVWYKINYGLNIKIKDKRLKRIQSKKVLEK